MERKTNVRPCIDARKNTKLKIVSMFSAAQISFTMYKGLTRPTKSNVQHVCPLDSLVCYFCVRVCMYVCVCVGGGGSSSYRESEDDRTIL